MKTYLEYRDRSTHKFWQVEVEGDTRTITTGKIGAKKPPKPKEKAFKTPEAALKSAEKEVAKKLADYWFDPTTLEGILASHVEFLHIPTDDEVEAHRAEVPHAPDDYFEVYRTGALSVGEFKEFGHVETDHPDDELDDAPAIWGAYSAEDIIDEDGTPLDPFFYLVGQMYDGSTVVQYNQGQYAGKLGVIDHGPSDEMADYIVEGDPDATFAAWLDASLVEPPMDMTLREYLIFRLLHHKGAAVDQVKELRAALAALEDAISGDPAEITELDLSDKGLRMLPDFVGECANLRVLNLEENEFGAVPEVVKNFGKLEILNMTYNPIDTGILPDWLAELPLKELHMWSSWSEGVFSPVIPTITTLEELHLGKLDSLPAEIGELSNLREFSATVNGPVEEGGIGRCRALKKLSLGPVTSLPDDIGNLKSLEALHIPVNRNALFMLPDSIGNLKALEALTVGAATLPPAIGGLESLQKLESSGNEEQGLPEELGQLTQLVELNLHYSTSPSLPESFGNLKKLEVLNLESSYIQRLPASFAELSRLRHLNLATVGEAETHVGDVLCGLTNLEFLAMNWATLHSLEGSFAGLERLDTVKVYTGTKQEGDFIELMAWVYELPNLKTLGVPYEFKDHFAEALPGVSV